MGLFGNSKPTPSSSNQTIPSLISNRQAGGHAALIFVHGFNGNPATTWMPFLEQLLGDIRLNDWDVFSAGYATNLSVDLPIWTSDPDIRLCAAGLITKLKNAPLDEYKAVALIAHSMGGLVVQRAILDSDKLKQRLTHVILYGTPSAGVSKAILGARLKPQARDMCVGSEFITRLRQDWRNQFGEALPFSFTVVAGESDAFIPASSSLDPFTQAQQAVVPGNHLEIVRPDSKNHLSYQLLYESLTHSGGSRSLVESARLAVEHSHFQRAIDLLMPNKEGLDAKAIVTLSLALESVGRIDDALKVIEVWNQSSSQCSLDAIGVLAGRLKRRWLVSRQQRDLDHALRLYNEGLEKAESASDYSQAYYHAINVAYLHLAAGNVDGPLPDKVTSMAKLALEYANAVHENQWSHATRGEAYLMLGELELGVSAYQLAKAHAKNHRECDSMYMQAMTVASRIFGQDGVNAIESVFEP